MPKPTLTSLPPTPVAKGSIFPPEYEDNAYMGLPITARQQIIEGGHIPLKNRFLVGVPTTGLVRIEWAIARYCQIIPTNWSASEALMPVTQSSPLNYDVADARNLICHNAITNNYEWLFFIDSDVILPGDCFLKLNEYMRQGDKPIIFGLYFTKSDPPEPLVYRGRGNSYFADFQLGEKFWVDGCGMGCTLINVELLRVMAHDAPEYMAQGVHKIKRIFDTPQLVWTDPENGNIRTFQGTEDLAFLDRAKAGGYFEKAGFPKIQKRKYFVYCDSSIFCFHIDHNGTRFPLRFAW